MSVSRRFSRVTLAVCVSLVLAAATSEASHLKDFPAKHRIVYQLSDAGPDRAKFVLGNIKNHLRGVGSQNIEAVELVVFGPGLKSFVTKTMDPEVRLLLEALQTQGMIFAACGNTMKNYSIVLEELPDGTKTLPQGGVVRIMELEDAGYRYIRP